MEMFANDSGESYNISLESLQLSWWENISTENIKHCVLFTVLIIIAYVLVFSLGIFGNVAVMVIIYRKPRLQTVTNMFIFNLAVADLSVLFFCAPATLLASVLKPWILGSFMCKGVAYIQGVSVIASAYSLVAISVDRCKAIGTKSIPTHNLTKTHAFVCILIIWIHAVIIPLPWLYVFDLHISNEFGNKYIFICQENWGNYRNLDLLYFFIAILFGCWVLPLILISICNLKIWWTVSHRDLPVDEMSSPGACTQIQRIHRETKRDVGKMLGIVTSTFLLSWLPLYVIATIVKLSPEVGPEQESESGGKQVFPVLVPLAQWLAIGNSCVNPVIYALFYEKFRSKIKCSSNLPKCFEESANKCCDGMMNCVCGGNSICDYEAEIISEDEQEQREIVVFVDANDRNIPRNIASSSQQANTELGLRQIYKTTSV